MDPMKKKSLLLIAVLFGGVVVFCSVVILIAFIFLPAPTNPAVIQEPSWDSPATRALAKRACFDCHSNETTWPIYSRILPVSFLVQRDVTEGRRKFNFSEWGTRSRRINVDEVVEVIREGKMPMPIYLPMHPEANLTPAEKQALINGLLKSLAVK
jgi:hypothetical protein